MGGAVLTTATLAGVSMFFALSMALNAAPATAGFVSMVWFLAILNLDRWLVSSLQRSARRRDILKIAIPRAALALLFGVIISTPLVLQIFGPEIEAEITKIRIEQSSANQRMLDSGPMAQEIKRLQGERESLLVTIAGGGTAVDAVGNDREADRLTALLEIQRKRRDANEDAAACELTGDKCKGRVRHDAGPGPYWKKYKRREADAAKRIAVYQQQLDERTESVRQRAEATAGDTLKEARTRLPVVQARLKLLQGAQSDQQKAFEEKNAANKGFLIRLKALDRASGNDFTLGMWRALVFLLITTLECLPIFVKILFLLGRPTRYDELLEAYERERLELGKQTARKERQAGFLANNDEILYADYVARERSKVLEAMAQRAAEAELEVAQRSLDLWRDRELRLLPHDVDGYVEVRGTLPMPIQEAEPGGIQPPVNPMLAAAGAAGNGRRRIPRWGTLTALFRRGR
ncbi:uncharacterized protein DUF4407 [Nonomuraea fuscirosea]|uniref:Uncharacterized protein DUF4407 n=2 Tax=Nonomuraea fuscirosea TaxID=1291556 RepID=A0A2T0N492_9ACTN|nr:uncharacterized protein DUF4407 [Nonomuraea fuscirosea]